MIFKAPYFVDINITEKCNMACRHCYMGKLSESEIDYEKCCSYIYQLGKLGVFQVAITGGEPLLYERWDGLLKYIAAQGMAPMINTNGVFFDENAIRKVDSLKKDLLVAISMDGLEENGYSELRRWKDGTPAKSAFATVINNTKKLIDNGFKVSFNFTYTKKNRSDLIQLYEYFVKEFGEGRFKINVILFGITGSGMDNAADLTMSYESWKSDLIGILEAKRAGNLKYVFFEPTCPWEIYLPLADYKYDEIERLLGYRSPLRSEIYYGLRTIGCHAGITNVVINWDGDVYPCGLFPKKRELLLGNLEESSLEDIWNNSEMLIKLRNLDMSMLSEKCQQCTSVKICGGGCRGSALTLTGNLCGEDTRCPHLN